MTPARAPRSDEGSEATRERILTEAEAQFTARGIEATQMTDVAAACRINRRTLYRYFPTKDLLAFEVELRVMDALQSYLAERAAADPSPPDTGLERVRAYFDRVDPQEIAALLTFTAEFDRYFQDDYPDSRLAESFVSLLSPDDDPLAGFIAAGQSDGSIRDDLGTRELYHYITQSFLALFQRLLLRRNHLASEHCADIDFESVFRRMILDGLRPVAGVGAGF